jgi:hypothetical protein
LGNGTGPATVAPAAQRDMLLVGALKEATNERMWWLAPMDEAALVLVSQERHAARQTERIRYGDLHDVAAPALGLCS